MNLMVEVIWVEDQENQHLKPIVIQKKEEATVWAAKKIIDARQK